MKILLMGSSQIRHIAELLTENGYKTKILEVKHPGKASSLIWYYMRYATELIVGGTDCVYWVYAVPCNSPGLLLPRILKKSVILHWIGTDVYNAIHSDGAVSKYKGNVRHLAGGDFLREELAQIGIEADTLPIVPFGMKLDLMKMPCRHAALVYLPKGKEAFYGSEKIRELALRNPELEFHIVAHDGYEPLVLPNVQFHGRLSADEMNKLYEQISILVRLPLHDGLSMMVIEALAKGKQVLYKYRHPYVYTPDDEAIESIDAKLKEILSVTPEVNEGGHEYVTSTYSRDKMMELYSKYHVFQ